MAEMNLSRRQFLKVSGTAAATTTLYGIGFRDVSEGSAQRFRLHYAQEITTICPFCSVGCGIICHVRETDRLSIRKVIRIIPLMREPCAAREVHCSIWLMSIMKKEKPSRIQTA
jgi:anaerobic selenocysteine-containing dehydrogenase